MFAFPTGHFSAPRNATAKYHPATFPDPIPLALAPKSILIITYDPIYLFRVSGAI
jgi:hypothetical protein